MSDSKEQQRPEVVKLALKVSVAANAFGKKLESFDPADIVNSIADGAWKAETEAIRETYRETLALCGPGRERVMTHREWTHTLVEYVDEAAAKLYRAGDGVMIGQRKEHVVVFGEEPNQRKGRSFIDGEHAQMWLETVVAKKDLEDRKIEGDPYIHKINGGLSPSGIVLVGEQGDLPGVMSKMSKM